VYLACAILVVAQAAPLVRLAPHWRDHAGSFWPVAVFVLLAYACEHAKLDVSDTVLLSPVTAVYVAAILLFPPPAPLRSAAPDGRGPWARPR